MPEQIYGIYGEYDELTAEDWEQVKQLLKPPIIGELLDNIFEMDDILGIDENTEDEEVNAPSKDSYTNEKIQVLGMSNRTITELNKIGIISVSDLLKTKRSTLKALRFVGIRGINEVAESLLKRGLHLAQDEIYMCSKCQVKYADEESLTEPHYCPLCQAKINRISDISDITVTLSPPEYSTYTTVGAGFVLYANITNNTYKLQKIRVCEFYIVSDGQQRSPEYFLTGYVFNEETIMPMTSRSCAKIWANKVLKKEKLTANDYAVITLEVSSIRHMFKFIFDGENWDIDDYFAENTK